MALAKLFSLDVKGRTYEKSHVVCSRNLTTPISFYGKKTPPKFDSLLHC